MRTPVLVAAIALAVPAIAQVEGERVDDPFEAAGRALLETYEKSADAPPGSAAAGQAGQGPDRAERRDEREKPEARQERRRPRVSAVDEYEREREKVQQRYWQERAKLAREYDREARNGDADMAARRYREKRRELEARLDAETLELERKRDDRSGG